MIASIAVARGLTLVTHNTAEFEHVPGLTLEDWTSPRKVNQETTLRDAESMAHMML